MMWKTNNTNGNKEDHHPEEENEKNHCEEETSMSVPPPTENEIIEKKSFDSPEDQDYDEEDDSNMLKTKVEAIDEEEAAAAVPALQRNAGFSRPGAFRSTPFQRTASVQSAFTEDASRRTGTHPPLEAVLVDHNSATANDQDDEMDVFTAHPMSVKEFVSSTPRCVVLLMSILCMVTVISVSVATALTVSAGNSEDSADRPDRGGGGPSENPFDFQPPPLKKELFFTHHAVIFGSHWGDVSNCVDPDFDRMEITITCGTDTDGIPLRHYKYGQSLDCTGEKNKRHPDEYDSYTCTIPYDRVSYVSFDCVTKTPVPTGNVIVEMVEPVKIDADDCPTVSEDPFTFIRILRFCSSNEIDIITDSECPLSDETPTGVCFQEATDCIGEDCDTGVLVAYPYQAIDFAECPAEEGPETEEQEDDSLEVFLKGKVEEIVEGLRRGNGVAFLDD